MEVKLSPSIACMLENLNNKVLPETMIKVNHFCTESYSSLQNYSDLRHYKISV